MSHFLVCYLVLKEICLASDLENGCKVETVAWSSAPGIFTNKSPSLASTHQALAYGFEVSWKYGLLCRECEASDGSCYLEDNSDVVTCIHYCKEDTPVSERSFGCKIEYYSDALIALRYIVGIAILIAVVVWQCKRRNLNTSNDDILGNKASSSEQNSSDLANGCKVETVASSSAPGIFTNKSPSLGSTHQALTYGFEVSWKYGLLCRECEANDDSCYLEDNSDVVTCIHYCKEDTPVSERSFRCKIEYCSGAIMVLSFLVGIPILIAVVVWQCKRRNLNISIDNGLEDKASFSEQNYNMFVRMLCISVLVLHVFCTNISEAQNNTQCSSSCGDIHNINFPFRLKSDPGNCGDSRFQFDCQNNRTVITFNSRKYNVLEINYDEFLIRAIDPGLEHKNSNCTSSPNYLTTSYPYSSTFDFGISIIPIIYVNCSATVNSSRYVETTFCGSLNKSHSYVAIGEGMLISDLAESCRVEMVGWGSARGLSGDNTSLSSIEGALSYGFELSWKRTFLCRECEASQGNCFAEGDGITCSHRCYDDTGFDLPLPFLTILYGGIVIVSILSLRLLFGLVFLTALIVYKWRRRHLSMYQSIEDFLQVQSNLLPIKYSCSEIKKMTNKFKEKLGEGAYGTVFKGKLRSGPFVAVKMMHQSMASGKEFISEVSTIGRIHHVNIVQLVGLCVEGSKRALVYEFMLNGSLDKYISPREGTVSLSYKQMFDISLGVASGIDYLHRGCDMQILHFDIKPHNILLDENFNPKISDFGLAKLYSSDDSIVSLTAARGTMGYMAPELFYKNIGGVSYKADVYSYGMLLMEMAGRRKNMNPFEDHVSQIYFPTWIYDQFNEGNDIEIQDASEEDRRLVKKMMIVALWCIQMKPADRPAMNKVVEMLEGNVELLQMPPRPFIAPREIAGDSIETIQISSDV
ncbi:hypothetical protein H5410_017030 [Solanum commersonii]|uniref:non-specific serine/threonine protein kinase n=1 Tax=Solanum commersonii TaxID=4109 RepID=A0A9J5ZXY8_SOLCO|nr:hypothetical protein H5410_017030 [Solanum commersonii]